jgi:hypothetical protein
MSVKSVDSYLGDGSPRGEEDKRETSPGVAMRVAEIVPPEKLIPQAADLQRPRLLLQTAKEVGRWGGNFGLQYDETGRLVVVCGSKNDQDEFVPEKAHPIDALVSILSNQNRFSEDAYRFFDPNDLEEILSGPIDCESFIRGLHDRNRLDFLLPFALKTLLEIMARKGVTLNLSRNGPALLEACFKGIGTDTDAMRLLMAVDPGLLEEDALISFLKVGNKNASRSLFNVVKSEGRALSPKAELFLCIACMDEDVGKQELKILEAQIKTLSPKDRRVVYRLANRYSCLPVVRIMNGLGLQRQAPLMQRNTPSIFAANMDVLEMRDRSLRFLADAGLEGNVVTDSFFLKNFKQENYVLKYRRPGSGIGRTIGAHYAAECGMRVPRKIIVIDDHAFPLTFHADANLQNHDSINLSTPVGVMVWAERIIPSKKQVSADEVERLLDFVERSQFWDNHGDNYIVADDENGVPRIVLIDSEFGNFMGVGSAYFGECDNSMYHGEFSKLKATVRQLIPHDAERFIARIDGWKRTCQFQDRELRRERSEQLQREKAALEETGCLGGCTFTVHAHDLALNRTPPKAPQRAQEESSCVVS